MNAAGTGLFRLPLIAARAATHSAWKLAIWSKSLSCLRLAIASLQPPADQAPEFIQVARGVFVPARVDQFEVDDSRNNSRKFSSRRLTLRRIGARLRM